MRIIYKFTILTSGIFYVGQFSGNHFDRYWGSGTIWNYHLNSLKNKYPKCWKKLIKREILYQGNCTQFTIDKLEEVYIRKEKAYYKENAGGCNILKGTANKFGAGSPMLDKDVVRRQVQTLKKTYREHPEIIERMKEKRKWSLENTDYKERISKTLKGRYGGEKNPNYGNYWTDEQKKNLSNKMTGRYNGEKNPNYGKKWTTEQRERMSKRMLENVKNRDYVNPMTGKVRITNGIINTVIPKDSPLPEGFWYGMKRRKK